MGEVVRLETPLPRAGLAENGLWAVGFDAVLAGFEG